MAIKWNNSSDYRDSPTDDTGSLYTTDAEHLGLSRISRSGNTSSITIPKDAELQGSGSFINATLNFSKETTIIDPATGSIYKNISINLRYTGYIKYHPKDENFTPLPETRNALIFQIDSIGDEVTLANGTIYKLSAVEKEHLLSTIKAATSDGNGYLAFLPTNEREAPITYAEGTKLHTDVPDGTIDVCFLAGTEIETPEGTKKVEDISVGDHIMTYREGERFPKKVTGIRATHIMASISDNEVVCIKAHAIDKNVPYKDLYVTGEHCLYLDGYLIPARMLVNYNSIVSDSSRSHYTIYHIECEEHGILCANGVYAETYLDTAHKSLEDSNIIKLGRKTWAEDAAAPLGVSRDIVEPIWTAIMDRTGAIFAPPATTDDPDLHLVYKNNSIIRPHRVVNGYYSFFIPGDASGVYLKSRTSRPSEVVGPFVDDRRDLGVLIDEICLFQEDGCMSVKTNFQDPSLTGWHKVENDLCRWTSGNAYLPIKRVPFARILSVHVAQSGPYLEDVSDSLDDEHTIQVAMSA